MEADDAPFSRLDTIRKSDGPLDTHPERHFPVIPRCEVLRGMTYIGSLCLHLFRLNGCGDPETGGTCQPGDEHCTSLYGYRDLQGKFC